MSFMLLGILNSQAAGAGAAEAFDLLETTTLTSTASSVTFSGLGAYSDYKHLQIRAVTRSDRAGEDLDLLCRFNSDTNTNYAHHSIDGNGSSVDSQGSTSQTSMKLGKFLASGAPSGAFGASITDVLDFSSANKNKTIRTLMGSKAQYFQEISLFSGFRNNTEAVTSIQIFGESNNLVSGSRFSLYGVK